MTYAEWLAAHLRTWGILPSPGEAWAFAEHQALERAATVCDEYGALVASEKDSALLVGKVDLSNAMSGEPRAAEFLAKSIRTLMRQEQ